MSLWRKRNWRDRGLEGLQRRPSWVMTLLVLLPILAGFAMSAAIEGATWPYTKGERWVLGISLAVMVGAGALQWSLAHRGRRLLDQEATTAVCKKVVQLLAEICGHPDVHVRANVMVAVTERNGTKRRVDPETAFNFEASDPDRELELDANGGVSGLTWFHKRAHVAEIDKAESLMTPSQQALVRKSLKTVLSVPIVLGPGRAFGTLQADSDLTLAQLGWNQIVVARAQQCADLIALHLVEKI